MRDLHVVALSEDGRHVVLATAPGASKGGFRVALDERLVAAVKGELVGPGVVEGTISVKEIQARLRAGESEQEIARSAGVPLARVERFAGPILSEREQVVQAARRAVLVRGRRGASSLPLGDAVDRRLAELPSMRVESVVWTAFKRDDGRWTVEVSWYSRGRTRSAQWHYDLSSRTVVSADPASAALGHVDDDDRDHSSGSRSITAAGRARTSRAAVHDDDEAPVRARPRSTGTARGAPTARSAAGRGTTAGRSTGTTGGTTTGASRSGAAGGARPAAPGGGSRQVTAAPGAAAGRPPAARPAAASPRPAARPAAAAAARRAADEGTAAGAVVAAPGGPVASGHGSRPSGPAGPPAPQQEPAALDEAVAAESAQEAPRPAEVPSGPPALRVVPPHRDTDEQDDERHGDQDGVDRSDAAAAARAGDGPDRAGGDADERTAATPPAAAAAAPEPAAARAPAKRGRASVPGWADVLLSTAPPQERDPEQ